ncbi:MAG TPA: hypothetical protein VF516_45280 [Kofleriaceae bacterium]
MTTEPSTEARTRESPRSGAGSRAGEQGKESGRLDDELAKIDALWRAANYLSVGQIYLLDNPLLRKPLARGHIKPRLLGHWGTTPGLNFLYVHLNRVIRKYDLDMMYVIGPGHGGPALVANAYLEGTYSEVYPNISQDEDGMRKLFKQFSFPGGIPSHVAPETPGSIHEGGELGYALSHAYGAAFDNRDLFVIANPSYLARIPREELVKLLEGYGYRPYFVEGHEPEAMHRQMAETLDLVVSEIHRIWKDARERGREGGRQSGRIDRPIWPTIVLPPGSRVHRPRGQQEGRGDPGLPVPTLETLAAVSMVRRHLPQLRVRVINIVDLMRLQSADEHPHGLADREFDALFTRDKPIIFAFHGYPSLIHQLTYRRSNHDNFHVHGFREEGTTTTPFDMVVLNGLDRFHLALDVIDRLPQLGPRAAYFRQAIRDRLIDHKHYIEEHGEDLPEITGWRWERAAMPENPRGVSRGAATSTEGDNV